MKGMPYTRVLPALLNPGVRRSPRKIVTMLTVVLAATVVSSLV